MRAPSRIGVVTNGTSGLGLSIARELGALGSEVSTVASLDRLSTHPGVPLDQLEVLVVEAETARFKPVDQTYEVLLDEIAQSNFEGTFYSVQMAVPHMSSCEGIILITDSPLHEGAPEFRYYCSGEEGIRSLVRTLLLPRAA